MKTVHGSMMDAVCPPADGPRSRTEPGESPHAPMAWAPVARATALQALCTQLASRGSAQSLQAGLAWPNLAFDPTAWTEGLALAQAAAKHWANLHTTWVEGLNEIAAEVSELRRANTVSKFVDQEVNLVQQSFALATNQLTASVRLMENVQNNVAFWMSQRATRSLEP